MQSIFLPTDLRGILKNNSTGRFACDHASVQCDGDAIQAIATDGSILAIVDDGEIMANDTPAPGEILIRMAELPSKLKDRSCPLPADADAPTGNLPPIDGIVPGEDRITATVTVNVQRLRRLLDAVCSVNDKEQTLTIGLQDKPRKPVVLATSSGIGVLMPVAGDDRIRNDGGFNDRVNRAVALSQHARSYSTT